MFLTDSQLDRLVDGECSAAERREVLVRCEGEPGAWRRLALAFVEAQTWRRELRPELSDPTTVATTSSTSVAPASVAQGAKSTAPRSGVQSSAWRQAALAAGLLLAFGLGVAARQAGVFDSRGGDHVATGDAETPNTTGPSSVARGGASSAAPTYVTLVDPSGREFQLPLSEASDPQWERLRYGSPAVPRHIERALRRQGFEVQQERDLIPIRLQDGRDAIVPVDNVNLNYVGQPTWQ